jgi:peptidoglycan/xylan/chitin deacetylase (PgdA/CDA1 family)
VSLLHTRQFSGWARGHLLCRADGVTDRFALTFDDGPNPRATGRLLDLLAAYGAQATFFVLAGNVRRNEDLVRRAISEGHELAVHGDTHWPLPFLLPGGIRWEVLRCADAIEIATGVRPIHYRPPFGLMSPGQARYVRGLGFEPVLGDVYPEDAHRPGVDRIVRRVLRRLGGGSILILHDGSPFGPTDRDQTVEALEPILREAATRGLTGTTVASLLPPPSGTAERNVVRSGK